MCRPKFLVFFFFLLSSLLLVSTAQEDGMDLTDCTCNCKTDTCMSANDPAPYSTTCWKDLTAEYGDFMTFELCGNASYIDMMQFSDVGESHGADASGTTADCTAMLLNTPQFNTSRWTGYLAASQLYATQFVFAATSGDCYLWVGGGQGAAEGDMTEDDYFYVGNGDLISVITKAITDYADGGKAEYMAVCGTITDCTVMNVNDGDTSTNPDFRFCVGGPNLALKFKDRYPIGPDHPLVAS